METFNLGDGVYLKQGAYIPDETNPTDTLGYISSYDSDRGTHPYRVKWSNGRDNTYNETDLIASGQVQVGDTIEIINNCSASWVKIGNRYTVLEVHKDSLKLDTETNKEYTWACGPKNYKIISKASGKSTFDQDAVDKQLKKINNDVLLGRAKTMYPPGTRFKSLGKNITYTVDDNPDYSLSTSDRGVYLYTTDSGYTYVCKDGEWAEIIDRTISTHKPQAVSQPFNIGDTVIGLRSATGPYSITNEGWKGVVTKINPSGTFNAEGRQGEFNSLDCRHFQVITKAKHDQHSHRPKLKAGDEIYIKASAKGYASKYAGNAVKIAYGPYYYGDGSYHITVDDDSKIGFLLNPDEWELPMTLNGTTSTKVTYNKVVIPEHIKELQETYKDLFYPTLKTNKNGTESTTKGNKSINLQRVNLKIRQSDPIRGTGLKGSGIKIRIGSYNRNN